VVAVAAVVAVMTELTMKPKLLIMMMSMILQCY